MKKVVEFLQKNPVQYLATVGRDGKAKCRPFMFCFEQDGKLWFCTNNTKDVYKDMLATVYKGNIIKNLIMDCQSYTKYRPNETTGGIFVSWRRKEELPTGA